ncbi:hypothetical protein [Paraburkholderia sp. J12]|uniref:hypothetical protein n=1 Tax=Paraburkholderia sp. J12 TaxID=2805432 RepID=UPI002ABE9D07|nr:hypothetical protein [Paraburkholderia sp. J12]
MEFDEDGLITPEALEQLVEYERLESKATAAHAHNMDIAQISALGRRIVEHCLVSVAENRDLLEQEGALNVDIGRFLKKEGYTVNKLDSRGNRYQRSITEGVQKASVAPRLNESTRVHSDFIINDRGDRVELKTSAFATPKDKVPDDLFDKDLAYLERDPYKGDFDRYAYEGLSRNERLAEMALFVADKNIACGSSRLRSMIGDIDSHDKKIGTTSSGLTYEVHSGFYQPSEVLEVERTRPIRVENFIVLLAYPSQQY